LKPGAFKRDWSTLDSRTCSPPPLQAAAVRDAVGAAARRAGVALARLAALAAAVRDALPAAAVARHAAVDGAALAAAG
jgi:hypothetical protein